ncbi:MAG TPA: hypothetical protein VMF65_09905 [Acidimicrobiales bacterium]|nr:hypothetical protein [Acidimicrobiales bacterium]
MAFHKIPDDLRSADSWETVIEFADRELGQPFTDDDRPTKKQRREDMTVGEEGGEPVDAKDIDMSPMVRLGSWNPEKLGKSTRAYKREAKKSHTLNTLDTYSPAFLGLMEISDDKVLLEGTKRKPGLRKASLPYYNKKGVKKLKEKREYAKTERENKLGYKPSDTYAMHEGPRFTSGGYGENYPVMYNTSQIIGEPTSFTVNLATNESTPFDLSKPQPAIGFSSEQKRNRQLVVWRLLFNASPWSFRPVYGRSIPVVTFYVGVVHTSPSIDIKTEIRSISDVAQKTSDKDGIPMVIVGDFYMQRSAKDIWKNLHDGKEEHWEIVHPKGNTNFPHKGEGQIADHSVFDKEAFTDAKSFSVPPLEGSLQPISDNPRTSN